MNARKRMVSLMSMTLVCAAGCATAANEVAGRGSVMPTPPGLQMAVPAPRPPEGPDGPITPAQRAETIDGVLRSLGETYVFPEKASTVARSIQARKKRGDYDAITTGHALATALTGHINEILKDAHFHVRYSNRKLPARQAAGKPSAEELARYDEFSKQVNGGFEKVERLPGNIGYIEVRSFSFPSRGYDAAVAAMSFVSETDALIVDIRHNGGGDPDMVASLSSYFFAEPVHLNDLYFRPENTTRQFWTLAGVPGKRYLDREIYVLTSKRTGSAAEEFAYNLKNLKRATIVGEVTWGGANPGEMVRLNDHFAAFVPSGRAINPISKTNWEGVGVKPDIEAPAEDALRLAQVKILEKRIAQEKDPERKKNLEERLGELTKK
jgi:retinol-binding protein 3